ncbi:MAG: hypothetical protein A3C93_03350 [Candidatus Lloydbacteria bacterium RIFCSPHIGHO2_02_FULL_54_17]|uniref:Uncharacterized protein n=1 Tax=Candidatus Lloydbacteria bacterium RIFCSPHIGHO2_02_FULL_54_17 TaxID=1798664 RepID=A0A1G2DFV8_9BACT|nr:MAG: hypothetical protein A2762_00945 [Candidatus Lloydbacteria bacterium RIFCSPHIGHO2_01_FULL_54_11]OGZ12322.1 MAG: hypothetical protein A3C93_03350 [Candidatus Lloydbacteria bacterium RIFCSPHIGHO2_02_FULL_54_17]OGZ14507.1 MAG: hypothetical protein A3H76_06110 [Candidatus Lloydbacteria bacterium RIFCSPLOWO2_02_FULL_54_12]OGZ14585.1 MAG: hypothetical protein A2948_05770 [Candidatus Lloydbacteria bacterium RIFCSPLOWO2_01_FULL_54_18]
MNFESKETLSPPIEDLVAYLGRAASDAEEAHPAQHQEPYFLSRISDRAGALYEKVRGAVDNKEEHFLRRHAIRRVVKRVGWLSGDPKIIAQTLIAELYRGGHLPRRRVSALVVEEVERSIAGFIALSRAVERTVTVPEFLRLRIYLLDIVSGAVEDRLYSTYNEEAVVTTLARILSESIHGDVPQCSEDAKAKLFYLSAWRSMFGADRSLSVYKLWTLEYPHWEHVDRESATQLAEVFARFVTRTETLLDDPFIDRLVHRTHNHAVAMTVIYGLVKRYRFGLETVMKDPAQFDRYVRETIALMYRRDIDRARRRSWRALLYIFLTKALVIFLAESLYLSALRAGGIEPLSLGINLLFHPLLLFFITRGIFPPAKENTERLVRLIGALVYGKEFPTIVVRTKSWGILGDIALAFYVVILSGLFVGIIALLEKLNFHSIDIASFLLFLVLVVYFGFRIRYTARRMELMGGHEGFFRSLAELAALPLVSSGRWLVTKFERLNIVAIFLDFFIELPFKLVLDFFDVFSRMLREKKEEIYS